MNPDYEERRTPQSLADMLGIRERGVADVEISTSGIGSLQMPSALRSEARSSIFSLADEGRGGSGWSSSGVLRDSRGSYRRRMIFEMENSREGVFDGSGNSYATPGAGANSSNRRRAVAPQRYTSLLDVPSQPSHHRWSGLYVYETDPPQSLRRPTNTTAAPTGQVPVEVEDALPTYEEAIAQPASTRVSIPLIAEAERQVPALTTHYQNRQHPSPNNSSSNNSNRDNNRRGTQCFNPSNSTTSIDGPCGSPSSSSSSRFSRFLRRSHSQDYIRPPPPQEGIPLELVTDKFGNRRRDVVWTNTSSGRVMWLGNLGKGGQGAHPMTGLSGDGMRLERSGLKWKRDRFIIH